MPLLSRFRIETNQLKYLVVCLAASGGIIWLATRYAITKPKPQPFRFPTAELAALDRDIQARFAVVPEKDFGIVRTYGNQHYLYNPSTPRERATVAALKKQNKEVAFYLMSRALWLRQWDGWGFKPIQGPVVLTKPITAPLPRRVNFNPTYSKSQKEIVDQDAGRGPDSANSIPTHSPAGRVVPSPVPPKAAPSFNELQALGNRVFELAEYAPRNEPVGLSETFNDRWKVVAVPIRANKKECLPCHRYDWLGQHRNPNAPDQKRANLGDALGVAFYLYGTTVKSPSPLASQIENSSNPR